jgi:hypothetical protein
MKRGMNTNHWTPPQRSSVRMEQLGSHWMDFDEILYLSLFRKYVDKIELSLKYDKNNWYLT